MRVLYEARLLSIIDVFHIDSNNRHTKYINPQLSSVCMASGINQLRSKDPVIAELARGFNKLYLTHNKTPRGSFISLLWFIFRFILSIFLGIPEMLHDDAVAELTRDLEKPNKTQDKIFNCESAYYELQLQHRVHPLLEKALDARKQVWNMKRSIDGLSYVEFLSIFRDLNHEKDILKCILVAMHVSKIISLDPAKPFMLMQRRQVGNYVQIGECWHRDIPVNLATTVRDALYDYNVLEYRRYVGALMGTDFEKYLTKEMLNYDISIKFIDGICYLDPQRIINSCAQRLLFKYNDPSDFSLVAELIPQIVPDIVIEYINLTMVIPRKHEADSEKLKYNQVQRDLGIDYSVLKQDLPIYHPEVVKYIEEKYKVKNPTLGDVLPSGGIGRLLERDRYMKTLSPILNEFDYPY